MFPSKDRNSLESLDGNEPLAGQYPEVEPTPPAQTYKKAYRSHKKLLIALTILAILIFVGGGWALLSEVDPANKANNPLDESGQKTLVTVPSGKQLLTVNSKLEVKNNTVVTGSTNLQGTTVNGGLTVNGDGKFTGTIQATNFIGNFNGNFTGDGSGLSNVNASNVATGTISDSRLSGDVALTDGVNNFTQTNTFQDALSGSSAIFSNNVSALSFTEDGSIVCDSAGNCPNSSTSVNGVSGAVTLAGTINQVDVSTSGNTITLGLPQDIDTSASPTFGGATVNGAIALAHGSSIFDDAFNGLTFDVDGRTYSFPLSSPSAQTICTTAGNCGGGGAATVLLAPGTAQSNSANESAIFINNTAGGNLIELQGGGTDKFVVDNSGDVNAAGTVTAGIFSGNGVDLTNVNAADLNGQSGSFYQNATNITSGTLSDSRLSANVPLLNSSNVFTGATNAFDNITQNGNAVCDTSGNCVGVGGGISGSGTTGTISVFTGSGTIGNSIITQASTTVTVAGTLAASFVQGNGSALTSLNAGNISSGTLSVARGGTGVGTFTSNGVIYGNGTNGLLVTAAGTTGECLVATTGGAPTWASCTAASGGSTPGGSAGGDLSGTYPNPTVSGLDNSPLLISGPTSGNFLIYNGSDWVNEAISNDLTVTSSGVATIANGVVTNAMLTHSSLTVTAGNGLSGGGSVSLGGSTSLAVAYGSTSNTAVQGNVTLTCPSGTGNLSGGGTVITLGTGGSCGNINTVGSPSFTSISLSTPLATGSGGTGAASFTTNGVVYGNGSGALQVTAAGTTGECLISTTASAPSWVSCAASSGGASPGGTAGGDLTGTYPDPTIASLQGTTLTISSLASGQVLQYNGSAFINSLITNANLSSGSFANISGTGGLTSGSIASGFGTISTANTIGTTAGLQGATLVTTGSITSGTNSAAGSLLLKDGSAHTVTLNSSTQANNITVSVPVDANSTDTVCLESLANCVGTGGGISGSGTSGDIPLFTGTNAISNSILSQASTTVTVAGTLAATYVQGNGSGLTNLNASDVNSGTLAVAYGGTGTGTFTSDGLLYGNGTSAVQSTTAGTTGECLIATTGSAPSWASCSASSGGATPGGSAGGDLSGTYPNPTVSGLDTTPLAISGLATGNFLIYNGSHWANEAISGDLTVTSGGVATIGNGAVTNAKLANSSLTVTAGNGLGGGGSVSLGSSTSLSVTYGSTSNTAVQGNVTLTCPSGTGNLSGGGGSITLGTGGSCGNLTTVASPSFTSLSLSTALAVGSGGTGAGTFTTNGILYGNATGAIQVTGAGTSGECLISTTASAPSWASCSASSGGATPGGSAGGDLTGTYPNPTIAKLQGTTLTIATLASGQVLQYNGSAFVNSLITNANLSSGSFSNVTGTGALSSGSIVSGFGAISTGNNISTTAALQGATVTATGALTTGTSSAAGSLILNDGSAHAVTLATPTQANNVAVSIPVDANTTDTVCLESLANCVGTGGGISGSGTSGKIALFTGMNAIGNSILSQASTTVTVGGTLAATFVQGDGSGLTNLNASNVSSGTLTVTNGGTGTGSFTSNGILYGNGTSAVQSTAAGTTGQCLVATTSSAPSWAGCAASAGGATPGGSAGGDLTGTYPNPTIAKLQGTTLTVSGLASGQVLQYNGSAFVNSLINNANLQSGNYANITGTGALTSGSIASGFGVISTGNNITTTAGLQGATVTATGTVTSGTSGAAGSFVLTDGSAHNITLSSLTQGNSIALSIPVDTNTTDTVCLLTLNNCGGGGSTTVGTLDGGTANAKGATISAGVLYLQSASVTYAGLVNTGTQSFAGNKTFTGTVAANALTQNGNTVCDISNNCGYASSGTFFIQGGNSFAAQAVLGTNDNNSLALRTNNVNRVVLNTSGNLTFQQSSTISAASSDNLSIDSGSSGTLNLGTTNAVTVGIGTNNSLAQAVNVGSSDTGTVVTLQGGTAVESINNTTGITLHGTATTYDAASTGTNLFGGFGAATNWTIGGSGSSETGTAAAATVAVSASPTITPSVSSYYQVVYTVSGYTGGGITPSFGGKTGVSQFANGTYTQSFLATSTANLSFTPVTTFTGAISAVSVSLLTSDSATLAVQSSTGVTDLEVRTGGTNADDTFVGLSSGQFNTTGIDNTSSGALALQYNTVGNQNTADGYEALQKTGTGGTNTATGALALQSNTSGYSNTADGVGALNDNTSGFYNTIVGYYASQFSNTADYNSALGNYALSADIGGGYNTAIGETSLGENTSGTYNSALGYYAGYQDSGGVFDTLATLQNSTAIGAYAQVQANDSIVLGSVDTPTLVGIGTTVPLDTFSVSPLQYSTGTASQTAPSQTITGVGTTWTSAMVGDEMIFPDGKEELITAVGSTTSMTGVSTTITESAAHYRLHYIGLQVTSGGNVGIGTTAPTQTLSVLGTANFESKANSTTAFQVQNAAGTSALTVDTTNMRVDLGTAGTPTAQLYVSGSLGSGSTGSVSIPNISSSSYNPDGNHSSAIEGNYEYISVNDAGAPYLEIVNISNPAAPVLVSSTAVGTSINNVGELDVVGNYVYMQSSYTVYAVNVTNPAAPVVGGNVGTITGANGGGSLYTMYSHNQYVYVTTYDGGVAYTIEVINVSSPNNPVIVNTVNANSVGQMTGSGQYMYTAGNNSANTNTITQVFSLANPAAPALVGSVTTTGNAYVGSLATAPGYLYEANCNGGTTCYLTTINVSNPASPSQASQILPNGNQAYSLQVSGSKLYMMDGTNGSYLGTYDITTPGTPSFISDSSFSLGLPGTLQVQGRYAYITDSTTDALYSYNLGGAYVQQLQSGSTETGALQVDNGANISGDESVQGALSVGAGAAIQDGLSVVGPTTLLGASTASDAATLGSNLFGGFNTATNWTITGSGATETDTATASSTAVTASPTISPVANDYYEVTYTVSGYSGSGTIQASLGGIAGTILSGNQTSYTQVFQVSGSANLTFTPSSFTGAISGVSVQLLTTTNATLTVESSTGVTDLEVRTGGTNIDDTFIGLQSGQSNSTGTGNTGIGALALQVNTTGIDNTAVGATALQDNSTGEFNAALGYEALQLNTVGSGNAAFGYNALQDNTTGAQNTAVGGASLQDNTTGVGNSAIGWAALNDNTTGGSNIAVGNGALAVNTTGSSNVAIGTSALTLNTTANQNDALGYSALGANTTGGSNVAIGTSTLGANTTGADNTAVGNNALQASNGTWNTAFGAVSEQKVTSGGDDDALGAASFYNLTTGTFDSALGDQAGYNLVGGSDNAAFGANALHTDTSGSGDTALGYDSSDTDLNGNFSTTATLQDATTIGAYSQVQVSDAIVLGSVDVPTLVGIGTTVPLNTFSVSPLQYTSGTASQTSSSSAITGVSTTWTSGMVGDEMIWADGTEELITAFGSTTGLTGQVTGVNETGQHYRLHYIGLQVNSSGNVGIGTSTPANALSVVGTISATGNLSVTGTAATGTLTINGHIITSGTTPTNVTTGAVGSGGTVSISGNDTSGTITLTTGSSGVTAGDMAAITFHTAYGSTPHIIITPNSSTSAALEVYPDTESASGFDFGLVNAPTISTTYTFEYFIAQ